MHLSGKNDAKKQQKAEIKAIRKSQENVHIKLFFVVFVVCVFGCLMVFSASSTGSVVFTYVRKQAIYAAVGLCCIFIAQFFNLSGLVSVLSRLVYAFAVISVLLLLTPLAVSSHGANRWLNIGIQFQPAELMKVATIIMLAYMVRKYSDVKRQYHLAVYMWAIGGIPAVMVLIISSDLSSAFIILTITFAVSFVYTETVKLHCIAGSALVAVVGMYVYHIKLHMPSEEELLNGSYRLGRIVAWIDPERYASSVGYQVLNALYAIGSGGVKGRGLGNSIMKLNKIPEAHNDMIFAVICEELGIIGGLAVIFMMGYITYLIVRVAINSESLYDAVLTMGIAFHIAIQSLVNVSVAVNAIPNTGVPLPFISYGGTSLLCNLLEIAIVVSISRKHYVRRAARQYKKDHEQQSPAFSDREYQSQVAR